MSERLPIYDILPQVRQSLIDANTLIVQAPPGAGKSTVLPLELLDAPWLKGRKIIMLEPRRLAAKAVAHRMASQLGERAGETVGYRVRFDQKTGPNTRIEVLTEGILTRMVQDNNALEGVGLLIFDEFHERSLHADLGLAITRQVQDILREDLRLLIMSATLDTQELAILMGDCPVLQSSGRQYPVATSYLPPPPRERLYQSAAKAVRHALREVPQGDVLVFLPGTADIRRTAEALEDLDAAVVHPLYGDLRMEEQERALLPDPAGRRKVVLATSIAETSLTIEGVRVVIDSGKGRMPRFDPRSGLTRLETVDVTLDSADQRAGRAGRLGPGWCFRLWSEAAQRNLIPFRRPEILSADLAPLALELAAWGIHDPSELSWPTSPPSGALAQARDLLHQLGALENDRLTPHGKAMAALPTHPRLAHMLISSQNPDISWDLGTMAADLAGILEERDPFPRGHSIDLRLRLDALRRHRTGNRAADRGSSADHRALQRINRIATLWRKRLHSQSPDRPGAEYDAGLLIATAYPERVALNVDPSNGRFRLPNGRSATVDPADPLADAKWLAIAHLDAGQGEGRIYLAAPVDPIDLPHLHHREEVLEWNSTTGKLLAREETRIGKLVFSHRPLQKVSEEGRIRALCQALRDQPGLLNWEKVEEWRARVMSLRTWRKEEDWPDLEVDSLLQTAEDWLGIYLTKVNKQDDFRRIDLRQVLAGMLPWKLGSRLDELAPTHLEVPTGSRIRLEYFMDGRPPVLAVKLQEMFGQLDTPTVNGGRNQVMVHLLSPARRPVQVTQDLRGFWAGSYHDVRKDLRGRYPKHPWPDDPFTAKAMRGVKKKGR